jgi:hypothetical protein
MKLDLVGVPFRADNSAKAAHCLIASNLQTVGSLLFGLRFGALNCLSYVFHLTYSATLSEWKAVALL